MKIAQFILCSSVLVFYVILMLCSKSTSESLKTSAGNTSEAVRLSEGITTLTTAVDIRKSLGSISETEAYSAFREQLEITESYTRPEKYDNHALGEVFAVYYAVKKSHLKYQVLQDDVGFNSETHKIATDLQLYTLRKLEWIAQSAEENLNGGFRNSYKGVRKYYESTRDDVHFEYEQKELVSVTN